MIIYNGASGGLGRHLRASAERIGETAHAIQARLEDSSSLARELDAIGKPDAVTFIHLAAKVSVPECEADPHGAEFVNVTLAESTARRLIQWARRGDTALRIIYVSSGHVYAAPSVGELVTEGQSTEPRSVYARTKLAAESVLRELCATERVPLMVGRVFGLIAPGQAAHYVLPGLIRRVSMRDLAAVPGLDFTRDYLDARDVCDDLVALASNPWPSPATIVNVCSGIPVTIRELLRLVIEEMQPARAAELMAEVRGAPGRPGDIAWLVGSPARFSDIAGIAPQRIPLQLTVRDTVANEAS